jgi:hypothetical protein
VAASDVYDLAAELLAATQAALATTTGGMIDRSFVSPGLPALDCCPQCSVHVPQLAEFGADIQLPQTPMTPAHRTRTGWVNGVTLVITVVRCGPTLKKNGDPPDPGPLSAAAQLVLEDAWAVWCDLHERHRDGSLFAGECRAVYIDPALAFVPQGTCVGWTLTVRAELDGYDPEAP